jgi:hypothetical protein
LRSILVNTRINILQWILTKLGTCLVLKRIWNPFDFQGHMSKIKSVTISLRNFVGEGIKSSSNDNSLNRKPLYEKYILISLYHVYVDNSKIAKYNFGSLS